ncbi:helix-turn-helix domain-containing protein [Pseudonocardia acaciae]|uniref:helix-turn-helix domain-containing protein n=1 Tax=Pseudonocardia acaciae TaxID=551276 RepID=UPI0014704A14|nr:helix-turn-helix transcriptional regulator [Pseudonocardia acaciae]
MIHNGEGVGAMADDAATVRMLIGKQIRQARLSRGWSQSQLARALSDASGGCITTAHYVSRWERGERNPGYVWAPVIEQVLDLDLSTSGATASVGLESIELIQPPVATVANGGSEDDPMRRRTLLGGGLGLTSSAALDSVSGMLEPVHRQLDAVLAGPITEHDAIEWERAADHYSRLVGRLPAEQVLPGILPDLTDLARQIETISDPLRLQLLRSYSLLSGLAATSLAGAGYWLDAERYWRTAERAARLSGDREVGSRVASKRAVLTLYAPSGSPVSVLSIADDALGLSDGRISPGSVNALAARAQGLALVGDRAATRKALSELETAFEKLDDQETHGWTAWSWPETRLHHVRSFVYSHGGELQEAFSAQDVALKSYKRPLSTGAVQVQMHRARSIISSGDPSQGVRHMVTMLEQIEPSFRHGYIGTSARFALQALPERAKRLPEVRQVYELISGGGT